MNYEELREYAKSIHGDQRYGKHNYIHHLDSVWKILKDTLKTEDPELMA